MLGRHGPLGLDARSRHPGAAHQARPDRLTAVAQKRQLRDTAATIHVQKDADQAARKQLKGQPPIRHEKLGDAHRFRYGGKELN